MVLTEALNRLTSDFSVSDIDIPGFPNRYSVHKISYQDIPNPEIIRYILNCVLNFPFGGRHDKMHWSILFYYKGIPCAISHEKFGLRFYEPSSLEDSLSELVLSQIKKIVKHVEKEQIARFASLALDSNELFVQNKFNYLDHRYSFFRQKGNEVADQINQQMDAWKEDSLSAVLNNLLLLKTKLGFYFYSMIDAYFSRLENFLLAVYCFSDNYDENRSLRSFILADWAVKLKTVFDITDKNTKKVYDSLRVIKEQHRNIWAHGGFDKDNSIFLFSVKDLGLHPIRMSDISNCPIWERRNESPELFKEICLQFTKYDRYCTVRLAPKAALYARSGHLIPFEKKARNSLLNSSRSITDLRDYIAHHRQQMDQYENVDY